MAASRQLTIGSFLARTWFPAALVVLMVLAIPALVLLVLNLLDAAGPVNKWLIENFDLSYQLALPPLLAFILLLVPPAILILYFLKLKRKPLQVPSTFLWKKSIEDLHVNSLFQWLRENVLLLLQLLAVLILIYGVMGFRFHGGTSPTKHYILIIDNSASMAAADAEPSRLAWAKQEALKEIGAAGDDDYGMVIVFNSKATTLQAYTNNRAKLREAVQRIEQTQRPTRIEEALNLADSLANPARSTEDTSVRPEDEKRGEEREYVPPKGIDTTVHLFSDGRYQKISEAALAGFQSRQAGNISVLGNLKLHYHMAGRKGAESVNNVGIIEFNAIRWGEAAKPAPDAVKLQVFVRLRNYRPKATQVKLHLDVLVDGKLVHPEQRSVELGARKLKPRLDEDSEEEEEVDEKLPSEKSPSFVLPALDPRANTVLRAYLEDAQDAFPLDDEAWLVLGRVRKAKVLIVGPGNPVLNAFFDQEATRKLAAFEQFAADKIGTEEYNKWARSGDADLVIFDRCTPKEETDLPQANTFFINQVPPPWLRGKRDLKNPYLIVSKKDHPLLKHLTTLWDVGVSEAFRFDLKENLNETAAKQVALPDTDANKRLLPPLTRLLEGGGQVPVLFTLPRGAYTDLVMTFALVDERGLNTNWPLQPSFPLFMRNLLYALGNVSDTVREVTVQPGEPMVLRPEAGVKALTVTPPQGRAERLARGTRADFVYGETEQLGVYRVLRDDEGRRSFAVNLLDGTESNIEPRAEIRIGNDKIKAGEQERKQPRELWKWIILFAFVLLLVEWYIYNRRVYV